jgi:hypothetical protein
MPVAALWTFIGSLVLLTLGLTYKWVENAHGLKLSEKEADRLRKALDSLEEIRKNEALGFRAEIDMLNNAHNKEIADIKERHQREIEKLKKEIADITILQSENTPSTDITIHNNPLDEAKIKILKHLFKNDNQQVENLAQALQLELQIVKFHVEELLKVRKVKKATIYKQEVTQNFVGTITRQIPIPVLTIDQAGRKYLIENGMV